VPYQDSGSQPAAGGTRAAAIVKAAGITRQAVCHWSAGYGQGHGLAVATGPRLASLPARRPGWSKGAPVLIVDARDITLAVV
jgi:hypothetical protein